jgi:integrase
METKWIKRWNSWIAAKPVKPGVFRRKEGGFLIRGKPTDPRTGKRIEIRLNLPHVDPHAAYLRLQQEIVNVQEGSRPQKATKIRFSDYIVSLFERKIRKRKIKSMKSRVVWFNVMKVHLLPVFGDFFIDAIRRQDVEHWLDGAAKRVESGEYSPVTVNNWLRQLKVIMSAAAREFEWQRDPVAGIEYLDTSTHATYTEEQPNSLSPDEVSRFLSLIKERHPQHFAMVALGFATGLRPSSLRPLRRQGPQADVLWNDNVLLVRQSQTCGREVMDCTKQGTRYRLTLPQELLDILRWHVEQIPEGPMRDSDLLFPSKLGGFRTTSVLKKVFDDVCRVMGLKKKITARAMRRTFQDLAREANIDSFVQRSICGHSTEEMSRLYSTVGQKEIQRAVGKVISMAGYRRLTLQGDSGYAMGMHAKNSPGDSPDRAPAEESKRPLTN